jgi:glyoxylase-like metal-dependent hydrolase (beta-lactamase superfamily II)
MKNTHGLSAGAVLMLTWLFTPGLFTSAAVTALSIRSVPIGEPVPRSIVPLATAQGRFLAPQAICCVDVSADGKFITVSTMSFGDEANVWQFSPDGTLLANRRFPPWAPMQAATLPGGKALAVGLAYSRVTSPDPTVWLGGADELLSASRNEDRAEADSPDGQFARLRPGDGDWRTGWFASHLGELFLRGPNWIFKPPDGFLDAEGQRRQLRFENRNLLPTDRALRMAASSDGRCAGFGWLGFTRSLPGLPTHNDLLSVWQVNPNQRLWSVRPTAESPPTLPNPVADFPESAKIFRLAPDALVPGYAAAALALNHDGSRVAVLEYAVWGWMRSGAAIGNWDPPIHVLNFLPKQRGRLRVFDGAGLELFRETLPEEGLFEIGFGRDPDELWCWPTSWFARGMAGAVWLPVNTPARTVYHFALGSHTAEALVFPDAVSDCAVSSERGAALVSCWDGRLYLLPGAEAGWQPLKIEGTARLAWSRDGAFAVAGTETGQLLRVGQDGKVAWSKSIPVAEIKPLPEPPAEVVAGLPIFQGGRVPGGEHAYVGDIWVIKAGRNAVMVDAGGTSGFSVTQARLRALGIGHVTHVLHTHSHGDHCGGAYLWRTLGAKIVGPKPAAFALTWLMPMLTDYGIYPPRPLDIPLPLEAPGDETDFELSGVKFHALFVPGHSFDHTVYTTELSGKRVAFTGDLGFENQDILHRCWGDADKARVVLRVIHDRLLPWRPDVVFTGHGVRTNGTGFVAELIRHTDDSLARLGTTPKKEGE